MVKLKGDPVESIFTDNFSSVSFSRKGDGIVVTLQREVVLTAPHGGESYKISCKESVESPYVIEVRPMHHILALPEDRWRGMYMLSVSRVTGIRTPYLDELEKKILSSPAALRDIGEQIDKAGLYGDGVCLIPQSVKDAVCVRHRSWGQICINSLNRDVDDPDYRNWFFPDNT